MTKGIRTEAGYENGEFTFKVYGENNKLLLSLPEGDKKYQGHFVEDGKLYVAMYTPEVGSATYEFTESGLVLKEKYEH